MKASLRWPWMQTHPSEEAPGIGQGFELWNWEQFRAQLSINTISQPLSKLCRYNGHCDGFYSVAEHSIHCATVAECVHGPVMAIHMLLHDAHEAFIGDITAPMKAWICLHPEFAKDLQLRAEFIDSEVYHWLSLRKPDEQEKATIKAIDRTACLWEAERIMATPPSPWGAVLQRDPRYDFAKLCVLEGSLPASTANRYRKRLEQLLAKVRTIKPADAS